MADKLTIARPYARAAFEEARGEERLASVVTRRSRWPPR